MDYSSYLGDESEESIKDDPPDQQVKPHDAQELRAAQRRIVDEFSQALLAEELSLEQLAKLERELRETRLSGRFSQVADNLEELAQLPPARAPEIWPGMNASDESPASFIQRVYQRWLSTERMHRGALRKIDKQLAIDYVSWKRSNEVPAAFEESFPTIQEFNSRLIEKRKQLKGREARRVSRVVTQRKRTM